MIELYTFGSTNGHKVAILLEELALPYRTRTIDVFAGEGQLPEFLAINLVPRRGARGVLLGTLDESQCLVLARERPTSRPARGLCAVTPSKSSP